MKNITYSIIIPQRNSIATLQRLFDSIPISDNIEIILIDNTPTPIIKDEIGIQRDYQLLWSPPEKHAGGARNVGLDHAHGEWLIFADADDYFADGAFEVFNKFFNTDYDVIYFSAQGIYSDTGEPSNRGDHYVRMVRDTISDSSKEMKMRTMFSVPWAKMVRRSFVESKGIRFEEIRASNDMMFSLHTGYYAKQVKAVDEVVYMVTTSKGSLTRRRDLEVISARYGANLRRNKFLKEHNLSYLQTSVMYYISESFKIGFKPFIQFILLAIKYKQNIFIGMNRWARSYKSNKIADKKEAKLIVK